MQISIYQYLTVTYQYLVNPYIVKATYTGLDLYLNNNSKADLAWIWYGIEIHNILNSDEILTHTKNMQDEQDSKIAYSINGSWYFNKTNVDGKWYIFRNIYSVIFNWLSVECWINYCPIVHII